MTAFSSDQKFLATATSTGNGIKTFLSRAFSNNFFAGAIQSSSINDFPITTLSAAKKVLAIPPPTINVLTLSNKLSSTDILVDTFDPPTIAISGFTGCVNAFVSACNSASNNNPAQDFFENSTTPTVEHSLRCAVANASITKISHNAAIFLESASSHFFSPIKNRTFSHKRISPGFISQPLIQSKINFTGFCNNSDNRFAIGANVSNAFSADIICLP